MYSRRRCTCRCYRFHYAAVGSWIEACTLLYTAGARSTCKHRCTKCRLHMKQVLLGGNHKGGTGGLHLAEDSARHSDGQ